MINARVFLQELNKLFPPCKGNNNLTFQNSVLTVTVFFEKAWYRFLLSEEDMAKDPKVLAKETHDITMSLIAFNS